MISGWSPGVYWHLGRPCHCHGRSGHWDCLLQVIPCHITYHIISQNISHNISYHISYHIAYYSYHPSRQLLNLLYLWKLWSLMAFDIWQQQFSSNQIGPTISLGEHQQLLQSLKYPSKRKYPSTCTCKLILPNVLAGKRTTQRFQQGVEVLSMCLRSQDIIHPCIFYWVFFCSKIIWQSKYIYIFLIFRCASISRRALRNTFPDVGVMFMCSRITLMDGFSNCLLC